MFEFEAMLLRPDEISLIPIRRNTLDGSKLLRNLKQRKIETVNRSKNC